MYPVSLNITGRLCVVVGGGTVAARKVRGLVAAGAKVRIISPKLSLYLQQLVTKTQVEWINRQYHTGDLADAWLVFAATDNSVVQQRVLQEAEQAGRPVNVVDLPDRCSFQVPAVVRRGDLTLTVSTNGKSPAVSAMIRRKLEGNFGQEYDLLLQLMSHVRDQLLASNLHYSERKQIFDSLLHEDIIGWIAEEKWDILRNHLQNILGEDVHFDISQLGRDA